MFSQRIICAVLTGFFLICPDSVESQKRKRKNMKTKKPSIIQTMTNSAGAIQAGRDVNIHTQPAPRQLRPEQFNVLTHELKKYGGGSVEVFEIGDPEATAFAQQFLVAIQASGWRITRSRAEQMVPMPYGLILGVVGPETPEGLALRNALIKAGLQVQVRI